MLTRCIGLIVLAFVVASSCGCSKPASERPFIDSYLDITKPASISEGSPTGLPPSVLDTSVEEHPEMIGSVYLPRDYFSDKTLQQKMVIARNLLTKGQFSSARDQLLEVLRIKEKDPLASFMLALAFQGTGDSEREKLMLLRTLDLDSRNPVAYYNLGCLYLNSGDDLKALKCFDASIELDPGNASALYNKAYIAMKWRLFDSAVSWLRLAHGIDPWNYDILLNLGYCCERTGRVAQAEACYLDAIALDGNRPEALDNLCALYLGSDRLAEAFEYAVKWRAVEANWQCKHRMAAISAAAGDLPASEEYLKEAFADGCDLFYETLNDPIFRKLFDASPALAEQLERLSH
ncbi:MAG: hypothetical protein Kow00107_00150 [Planctomycetota bacterium]